jgi:hypothetical protein
MTNSISIGRIYMTSSQTKKAQENAYILPIEVPINHKKGYEDYLNNSLGDHPDDYPGAGAILSGLYAKDDNTAYHIPHRGETSPNFIPVEITDLVQVNITYIPPPMAPTLPLPVANELTPPPILIIHIVGGHDSDGAVNPGFADFHWE